MLKNYPASVIGEQRCQVKCLGNIRHKTSLIHWNVWGMIWGETAHFTQFRVSQNSGCFPEMPAPHENLCGILSRMDGWVVFFFASNNPPWENSTLVATWELIIELLYIQWCITLHLYYSCMYVILSLSIQVGTVFMLLPFCSPPSLCTALT